MKKNNNKHNLLALCVTLIFITSTISGQRLDLYNNSGVLTIQLDPDYIDGDGRIIVDELQIKGGSDFAEYFDLNHDPSIAIKPGMLVSIDPLHPGSLMITDSRCDKKLVGVISGANGIKAGVSMRQEETIADGSYPIGLKGRVYVLATNEGGIIQPGDFITSSSKKGYAMKAGNPSEAVGAIVGKAMTALDGPEGYILLLLNLQ